MKKILIVGAGGQIGSELTSYLRGIYGGSNVIAADLRENEMLASDGPFVQLDALNRDKFAYIVHKNGVDAIYNLVALLSASG